MYLTDIGQSEDKVEVIYMKIIVEPIKEINDILVAVNCQPASDMQY